MRSVGLSTSIPATKGSAELNHHKRKDLKEVRNGAAFDGQRLSEEDDSRINDDVNGSRRIELLISHDAVQRHHQQPQGSLVQWERFLPTRSLKVLLVEDDDSTRHVVSALLRNCSYEVTAVANGVEAWKVLIDLNKQIDLVLTEVVMPYLSGVGLLSKIMNHAPRKNIPVIMMSSDDSMGIVFNCLSKGAVDFLVKPIRKNELKNLWQHVWRKCHSSSGSESESGIRAPKPIKVRSDDVSDDGDGSDDDDDDDDNDDDDDDDDDDRSIGLTAKDGSDNGSGTQSSWSKRAVEVESTKYSWDQLPTSTPPDSTCAQVIRTRAETSNNYHPKPVATKDHAGEDDKIDTVLMGKDLGIGVSRNSGKFIESNSKEESEQRTKCMTFAKANDVPALELSLKRPRDLEDTDTTSTHRRNVLKQSDLSAFSRYNNNTTSETAKPLKIQSNSNGAPNQRSNGSSTHNNDMGSSTNNAFAKPEPLPDDKSTPPPGDGDTTNFQVRHHHHHYHHHHHHVHKTQPQQKANQEDDDGSSRNKAVAPVEGDAANYGSASGSNNKSNGENGGSSGQKGGGYGGGGEGGDNGVVAEKGKIGNGSGSGSGSGSGVDKDRLAQREAALNKFRQKRKDRCFEKKVRYHSRKKLAEQRPRVRGQFVRQEVNGKDAGS
ncbi:two-component response regulator-like APRR3 isoform X2 [Lactuca sativa]|uniref:Uncharacterized protein n=1 Tax=Lactuca sativa TaxID=4236 RepID=A0A9R1XS23_LACSA|nr:two-component response regulator-like APRR3 isoform X2 [Lactuca sativa]KAJ0219694.1 hypothetical protein LSAT_V11C200092750 [Lactuca sativa]